MVSETVMDVLLSRQAVRYSVVGDEALDSASRGKTVVWVATSDQLAEAAMETLNANAEAKRSWLNRKLFVSPWVRVRWSRELWHKSGGRIRFVPMNCPDMVRGLTVDLVIG